MKKIICIIMVLLMLVSFSACSEDAKPEENLQETEEENFDPKEYDYTEKDAQNLIQWNLDMIYKGEISEEGAKSFGLTQEDVFAFHKSEILMESENLVTLVCGEKYDENIHERCFNIIKIAYSKTDYVVGEATKVDDKTFEVPVTICAFKFFEYAEAVMLDSMETLYQEYPETNSENVSEEDYEMFEKLFSEIILETFEFALDAAEYDEPKTVIVEVVQLPDGTWNTTEESFYMMISEILK